MAYVPKYALWLRPSGETAFDLKERIHELSKKYDTPTFEPHITLISGLKDKESNLIQFTDTLAGSLSAFNVELNKLGYRDSFYQCFYAEVKKSEDLMVTQQTARKFFKCDEFEDFFPHLSLMYGDIPERKKKDLLNTLGPSIYLSFNVHNLLLIKSNGDVHEWEKIHTADFNHQQ